MSTESMPWKQFMLRRHSEMLHILRDLLEIDKGGFAHTDWVLPDGFRERMKAAIVPNGGYAAAAQRLEDFLKDEPEPTEVIGEVILDEGNFVLIVYANGSINMPLSLLSTELQQEIKDGKTVKVCATFQKSDREVTRG